MVKGSSWRSRSRPVAKGLRVRFSRTPGSSGRVFVRLYRGWVGDQGSLNPKPLGFRVWGSGFRVSKLLVWHGLNSV